jgi:hypothetical protein
MPYHLKKKPGTNLYWVVSESSGKHFSKSPLPLDTAKAQMAALYIHTAKEATQVKAKG